MQQIQKRCLTGPNFVKAIHTSKEILIEKVNQQRKVIKRQNELIIDLKKRLKEKIEKEEEKVSNNITNIIHTVIKDVINKSIDISTLHPIFRNLFVFKLVNQMEQD
ncbi:uncharacterized protein OCT59_001947 [Rhizophagus irregularis]|uniref:Uncharacterized protein n=2 Tax=Rhizophagus irregularis TaxID=588596 RepID=A0A015JW95_RHIIW|nr:hypothetical protein RirG_056890 [Rhizophagus irregularis DAOM 197198w]UZO10358.1 hypothetical protein OCT59_001947 [Rhizophagus irregularis]GBC47507.1 hypothetical protein GLOIN_2v1799663 [Rhizophagus irregularis DAOM 181602=DAOM 197198]